MTIRLLTAALVLVAASAYQAQACGGCGCQMKMKQAAAPAQEKVTQNAHHHPSPLAMFAVSMYGELGDQIGELRSKAEGGCQDSRSTLRADAMHSVESMLKALKNPEMRKMVEMGMMLQDMSHTGEKAAHSHAGTTHASHDAPEEDASEEVAASSLLTSLESQLSKELKAIASAQ